MKNSDKTRLVEEEAGFYRETNLKQTPLGRIAWEWRITPLEGHVEVYENPLEQYERAEDKSRSRSLSVAETRDNPLQRPFIRGLSDPHIIIDDRVFIIRSKNPEILDNEFLYYILHTPIVQEQLRQQEINGKVEKEAILKTLIPLPPIREQKLIAKTLSGINETIETLIELYKKLHSLEEKILDNLILDGRLEIVYNTRATSIRETSTDRRTRPPTIIIYGGSRDNGDSLRRFTIIRKVVKHREEILDSGHGAMETHYYVVFSPIEEPFQYLEHIYKWMGSIITLIRSFSEAERKIADLLSKGIVRIRENN